MLVLQSFTMVAPIPAAVLAFGIARRASERRSSSVAAWLLAATCFLVLGVTGTVQAVFAHRAFAGGVGSVVWDQYLVWSPAANYGRSMVALAFAGSLLAVALRPRSTPQLVPRAVAGMGIALLAGIAMGMAEGPLDSGTHMPRLAVLTASLVILLLGALLAAAARDAIDRLLWLAMAVYALKNALSVSLLSVLAWLDHSRAVSPETLYAMAIAAWVAILALVVRRYQLAVREKPVLAIFERGSVRRRVMV